MEITIPIGTTLVQGSGTGDSNFIEASYSDLKVGSQISIWNNEDGSIKIIKIRGL
jgi:hypothetical protein